MTPGGRRLPPLGLSPGSHISIPATPGGTLWNSLLNATNTDSQSLSQQGYQPGPPQNETVSVSIHPHQHQPSTAQAPQAPAQAPQQPPMPSQQHPQSSQLNHPQPHTQPPSHLSLGPNATYANPDHSSRSQIPPQSMNPPTHIPPVSLQQIPPQPQAQAPQQAPQQPQSQQPTQTAPQPQAPPGPPQIHLQPSQPSQPQPQPQVQPPNVSHPVQQNTSYSQFGNTRKSGLTPNESNLRTGLTPSGAQHNNGNVFPFNSQLSGFTPNGIINSPMTPGLSSLLGLSNSQGGGGNQQQSHIQNGQPLSQGGQVQIPQVLSQQIPQSNSHLQQTQGLSGQTSQTQSPSPRSQGPDSSNDREEVDENGKRKINQMNDSGNKKPKSNRGRKPKNKPQPIESDIKREFEDSPVESDDKDGNPDKRKQTEEEKRKHFLERNRLAASKCRQRKKQMAARMEDELKFFSSGYKDLTNQVLQLREQLVNYRNIFNDHKSCPMLASHMGGYNELNDMLQQTNYVLQATEKDQDSIRPLPSTIATALSHSNTNTDLDNSMGNDMNGTDPNSSNPNTNPSNNEGYDNYSQPPSGPTPGVHQQHPQVQHQHHHQQLPMSDPHTVANSGATSTSSIPTGYGNVGGSTNISTHHSMTDLPEAAAAAMAQHNTSVPPQSHSHANGGVNIHQPQASDIRAINSMTNLEALNHDSNMGISNNAATPNPGSTHHDTFNLRAVNSMIDLHQMSHQNNLVNLSSHNT